MVNGSPRIHAAMRESLARGELGVQVAVYKDSELVIEICAGVFDRETHSPVVADTLFPVFSVTKAITATALHIQAERGLVDYAAPIAEYWPEYGVKGKERTTVRDLLMHRSGAPQLPSDVTTERLTDWQWMTERLADETPIFEPGTTNAYHTISWGWLVGEIVRRSDGMRRSFGRFVREEICDPLRISDLYIGLPASEQPRVAQLVNGMMPGAPLGDESTALLARTMPAAAAAVPGVFGQAAVQAAEIPGAGGVMNARSAARVFAMLACGGELDGVRLVSESRLRSLLDPRPDTGERDRVSGTVRMIGVGGYWLGGEAPPGDVLYGSSHSVLGHPGAGGSNGWADLDSRVAIVICHNRMFNPDAMTPLTHPFLPIVQSIHAELNAST
jgi:CubicO group peptidase (beta-lactamase class C family)